MELLAGIIAVVLSSIFPSLSEEAHPRLLLAKGEECRIVEAVGSSDYLRRVDSVVFSQAAEAVRTTPTEYRMTGRRLLDQSRRSLKRLFSLSYAYRFSGGREYLLAAVSELESVCSFPDWNPSHYLDVAEMCLGVSIAYDWLYDSLSSDVRSLACEAIERLALDTALDPAYDRFYNGVSNWLQVCNTGLVFGALAIADKAPDKAGRIIRNYFDSIVRTVDSYDPDGAYPEGPMYWSYGTEFNTLLNYQLEKAGLKPYTGKGGFQRTGEYYLHSMGPSGLFFNYSDGGARCGASVAEFYFAVVNDDPSLLWNTLRQPVPDSRLLPAALIFASEIHSPRACEPESLSWLGRGSVPVYYARTSWEDPDASFFGVKGGRSNHSHSHLDQGSFVFDALGERWVVDLGNEDYTQVEKAGIDLWNMSQTSQRWDLIAYDNMHHSTMTFDGRLQNVEGKCEVVREIKKRNRRGVLLDLSGCYDNVASACREICLRKDGSLEIRDAVGTADRPVRMDWNLMTGEDTDCVVMDSGEIALHRNGKTLVVSFHGPKGLKIESRVEKCVPKTSYERIRAKRTGFTVWLPAGTDNDFKITLKPIRK